MEKEIGVGSLIAWREFNGTRHEGVVEEMDSNMAIVSCIFHEGKKCVCDNC